MKKILFHISVTILDFIILILHTIGFYLLSCVKYGRFHTNRIIVKWLSGAEILYSIVSLTDDISFFFHYDGDVVDIVVFIMSPVIHFIVLLITLNRFVACIHPVFYKKSITKKVVHSITFGTCLLVVVAGISICYVHDIFLLSWMAFAVASSFLTILYVYTKVYHKIAASTLLISKHLPGRHNLTLPSVLWNFIFHQGHATSLLIALCYTLFIIIPFVLFLIMPEKKAVWNCVLITVRIHYILDAVIYVYTDRAVRRLFVARVLKIVSFFRALSRSNRVYPSNGIEI